MIYSDEEHSAFLLVGLQEGPEGAVNTCRGCLLSGSQAMRAGFTLILGKTRTSGVGVGG